MEATTDANGSTSEPLIWPEPLADSFDSQWPQLTSSTPKEDVLSWVTTNGKILVRTVTWNLCANPPPASSDITSSLLPRDRFHLYIIGTEECERSIARSALNPSKKSWEAYLKEAIGPNYVPVRSHTLQAIHLVAFVHKAIAHLCTVVTSAAVPTGVGSTLGNKGGVGLLVQVGSTRLLVVNAHLAAHQTAERRRNAEFNRIDKLIPVLLEKKEASLVAKAARSPGGLFNFSFGSRAAVQPTNSNSNSATPTKPDSTAPGVTSVPSQEETEVPALETIVNNQGEIVGVVQTTEEDNVPESPAADPFIPATNAEPAPTSAPQQPPEVAEQGDVDGADITDAAIAHDADNTINTAAEAGPAEQETNNAANRSAASVLSVVTNGEEPPAVDGFDANKENALDGTAILDVPASATKCLEKTGDFVVFMGDLNYRIKGNRKIVSSLLQNNMHEVLLHNDQLRWNMAQSLVLQGFTEGPLNFKPTYKYDVGTQQYDTSSKGRIPSWTDRILYVPRPGVTCLAYNADDSITTSDHHPVYASFSVSIQLDGAVSGDGAAKTGGEPKAPEFTSESQVCTIM